MGGSINVQDNQDLENFDALDAIISFDGHLIIQNNFSLIRLPNLSNSTSIEGLTLIDNYNLPSLQGLNTIETIHGDIAILLNREFTNLNGLQSLTAINGGLRITSQINLVSFAGLENLISIEGRLNVQTCPVLTSINLPALTIADSVILLSNDALTNLDGLSALTSLNRCG